MEIIDALPDTETASVEQFNPTQPAALAVQAVPLATFNPWHGLGAEPFPAAIADVLLAPADPATIKIRPDGLIYVPAVHWRRRLTQANSRGPILLKASSCGCRC